MLIQGIFFLTMAAAGPQAQDDAASLVLRLSSDRPEERTEAATALRAMGDRAVPALEKARASADPEIRLRVKELLHEVRAISALVEDLRSDDIPGNAKSARNALLKRYDGSVRGALLEAIRSDDAQQAIQAAFVLIAKGEAAAVWREEPRLLTQAIGMFMRQEDEGFHWVAAPVLLRLGKEAGPLAEAAAYRKALAGVAPSSMDENILQLAQTCGQLKIPFPGPLLRRYFENLRDDTRVGNAASAARVIFRLGDLAVPELRACLSEPDLQARHMAVRLLLDLEVKDLGPAAFPVLGELLGRDNRALGRLVRFGEAAVPTLEDRIESVDPPTALRAAEGLAQIDRNRWWARAARVAVANLQTDNFVGNAQEAAAFLVGLGKDVAPLVRGALASDDEQVVACAVGILDRLGEPAGLETHIVDQLFRLATGRYGSDEASCLYPVLRNSRPFREAVLARLARSGLEGSQRAAGLEEIFGKPDGESGSWFLVKSEGAGEQIRSR